jgi:translocation and assembly module TamB
VPDYDVRGPFRFRLPGDTTDLVVLAGRITASGTGIDPASAHLDVDVALSTIEIMTARLESGHIVASMDSGRVAFRLDARSSDDGRLAANGNLTLGDSIGFTVSQATVRDFDIAAFLGDTIPSRLDADFTASGVAGQPDLMLSDIQLTIREGQYGELVIDTMAVGARLAGGRLNATGRALSNAGRADFELSARPFAEVPSFDVDQLRFADIDLGVLSTDTTLTTSITGSASGTGRGTSIEQLTLDLSVELDSSRVGRQVITDGQGTLVLLESRADVVLDLAFVDSGGIHIAMNGRPFAERATFDISEADFRALDPFAFTGTPGDSGDARASLNGSIIATVEGLDARTMVASGTLRLGASRIDREPISEGLVEWTLDDSLLNADATIDFATGRLTADAAVTFAEADMSYVLDAVLHSGGTVRLAGEDSVGTFVDATVSVEGRGTSLASMTTRIHATADSAAIGDLRVDTLRLAVLIDRGVATIDSLRVNSNFAHVTGSGSMPVSDSAAAVIADLTVDATIRSLDAVQRWLGIEPLGLGAGEVHFAVTGPADSLRVDATVAASAALFGRTRLIGLESSFQGRLGSGLRLASATGTIELDRLDFAGFEVRISRISGEWNGDELALEGEATIDDRRDLTFAMRVDPRIGAAYADLDQLDFRMDEDRWELTGTPTISWADGIRVDSLVLSANNQVIAVNGLLDTDDRSDFNLRIEQFRMGSVSDLLGYDRLDGTLTASFGVQGPAASPRITGGMDARIDWQGGQESSVVAAFTYDTLRLDLDASIRADRGGALTIAGGLPIDLALTRTAEGDTAQFASAAPGSVDLTMRADSFGIEWVEPFLDRSTARDFNGQLQIDARVTGSQADPILSGSFGLSNGRVTVPRLGVTYEDAVMRVSLDANVVTIDSARARTGVGTITLGGSVSLPELSLGEFDIEAQLDEFRAIHNDAFRVSASGAASINGTTSEPRLVGNIDLVETDIRLDDRVSGASVRPVELTDEQVRELEEYFGLPILVERDPNALFEALTIDLDVSMSRDTWVRQRSNPKLEIQLTGDVRVTKEPQDSLRFNGRIEAVPQRSYVEQFGKRFAIETGVVELQGMVSEAQLDISAAYRVPSTRDPSVPEAIITLGIEGTMNDLTLLLGSEPEMENADIVSYLATGRPAATSLDFGQSGGSGGIGSIGSDLALGQVTGLVEGLAAEGVGLDVIEIRPDGLRGATLIAGRYVTPRVYVGFKQPIGRDPDDADGRSEFERTEVELEYQAVRWLLLNMQASNSAVSFLFRFRHAY